MLTKCNILDPDYVFLSYIAERRLKKRALNLEENFEHIVFTFLIKKIKTLWLSLEKQKKTCSRLPRLKYFEFPTENCHSLPLKSRNKWSVPKDNFIFAFIFSIDWTKKYLLQKISILQ